MSEISRIDPETAAKHREADVMTIVSAGLAQDRAPALPTPEMEVSNPLPRSTAFDRVAWHLGRNDAAFGRPVCISPAEIFAGLFDGDRDVLSYLVGYRAGERDRARGQKPGQEVSKPLRCEPVETVARPRTAGMACARCGCTDDRACPGGCWWVSHNPPLCSACALKTGQLLEGCAP